MKPLTAMLLFIGVACGAGDTILESEASPEMTSMGPAETRLDEPTASPAKPLTTAAPERTLVLCPDGEYPGTFRASWVFLADVPVVMNVAVVGNRCIVRVPGIFDEGVAVSDLSTWGSTPEDLGIETTARTDVNIYRVCVSRRDPSVSFELDGTPCAREGISATWCTPAQFGINNSNTRTFVGTETIEVRIQGSLTPAYGPAFESSTSPQFEANIDPETGLPISQPGVRLSIDYPCDPPHMEMLRFEKYTMTADHIIGD